MAVVYNRQSTVTDGLVLCLDAGNPKSYSGSGTAWNDITRSGYHFTLTNSPIFGDHRGTPCFTFSGANDYATRTGTINHDIGTRCTLSLVMASVSNANFGSCSRLFSVNDGGTSNVDYSTYFTTASCDQTKFGLWYKNSPAGLYPTSSLKSANDDYKYITYKWTAGGTAYVFLNGVQQASSAITTAFNYLNVGRMSVGVNSGLGYENANVRVAMVQMYDRELSSSEITQNFNALRGRFGI